MGWLSPPDLRIFEQKIIGSNRLLSMMHDSGLQPPRHLTEKQHRKLQTVQETIGMCWGQKVMESLSTGEVLLDLLFTNTEEIREVKIGGSLGCSDHALMEYSIWRHTRWIKSQDSKPQKSKFSTIYSANMWNSLGNCHLRQKSKWELGGI